MPELQDHFMAQGFYLGKLHLSDNMTILQMEISAPLAN